MIERTSGWGLIVALMLPAAGCNGGDTLGLADGRANATVNDAPEASSTYSGVAAGNFQASVSADGQRWIALGSFNGITVALQSAAESSVHGTQDIPVGTYEFVRLVMEDVDATLLAGSTIEGTTLEDNATVQVASGDTVRVVRQILPVTVGTGTLLRVRFDLNSEGWLTLANVQAGSVTAPEVEEGVSIQVTRN